MSNGQLYISYYNIIAVGNYPSVLRLTQKSWNNPFQYLILNDYIIETELSEWNLRCETKYITSSKVCYTISWKEGHAEWSVVSTKSSTAVVNSFLKVCNSYFYYFVKRNVIIFIFKLMLLEN